MLILILSLLNDAEVSLLANADTRVAKTLRSMRSISINNDLLRYEQILNCYIFVIMTLLRQTRKRLSRDSICNAMTLISDKYEILYAEVKREIRERAILYYLLQSTAPNSCLRIITHLAQRKMQCNYNSKTRLRNNNRYAKAVFIQTLEREVGFKDKRSSIYYYTKTADS
ncbi:hypothetical protein HBH51_245120 [Parastagonospora nodorum]|nr:hypothetical protein HBH51_245120 [Parastagonospora nodorum]